MEITRKASMEDRFIVKESTPELDINKILTILKEIKMLKDTFPHLKIATKSSYEEIKISNIRQGTDHFLHLKYEKSCWRVVLHQLPVALEDTSTNLQNSVKNYIMTLDNLKSFYNSLAILDDICIVGEPEVINPKITWRLVKYSKRCFIRIEFMNPYFLDEVSVTFHGCTSEVKEKTEIYNSRSDEYDNETIYNKLLQIFNIAFFPATEEDQIDCSICLCYRCENNRCPVVCCDNEKCDSTFHISCLEKYLKIEKQVVKVLSICIGKCPFCKQKLSNSYAPFFGSVSESKE